MPAYAPGDLLRIRDERWRVRRHVPQGAVDTLDVEGCDTFNRGRVARFLLPFDRAERLVPLDTVRVVSARAWRCGAAAILADATRSPCSIRAAASADVTLISFQLEPALAMTSGRGCRFLIADDVGLGKTIQAGLMIAELLARDPDARALVVCPAGLRLQWQEELHAKFALSAEVRSSTTIGSQRLPADVNPWALASVLVASIDYVKRPEVMRALETLAWDIVVFDEAHALAGRSDRAAAAALLAERARHVVMLSATPHSGDTEAFARLVKLGDIGGRFPALLFRRTRADAGLAANRRARVAALTPSTAERTLHDRLLCYANAIRRSHATAASGAHLAAAVLLRRAASSAASLERSIARRRALLRQDVPAQRGQLLLRLEDEHAPGDEEPDWELAAAGLPDAADEQHLLEELAALAGLAALDERKVRWLRTWLRRVKEPVLVFTEYRDTLERLVDSAAPHAVLLHGGMNAAERADSVRRFTSGAARVMLATDAGSEGLNLQARCRVVVHLEAPWTPARLEQRIGRVDRIGQSRRVHSIVLALRDSADDPAVARLHARAATVADALSGAGADSPSGVCWLHPDARADDEVRHASLARQLRGRGTVPFARPFAALLRDRRTDRVLHVFGVQVQRRDGPVLWQGVVGTLQRAAPSKRTHDAVRRAVTAALSDRHAFRARAALPHEVLDRFKTASDEAMDLWLERERAMRDVLTHRHARLAAALVQRGLFDRREERAANAQDRALALALDTADRRIHELERAREATAGEARLLFAALF